MAIVDLAQFEYLFVLAVGGVAGWIMFERQIRSLLRNRAYWVGTLFFSALSYGVDRLAQRSNWWTFSSERLTGIVVLSVPLEEHILFLGAYLLTVAAWEEFQSRPPRAVA